MKRNHFHSFAPALAPLGLVVGIFLANALSALANPAAQCVDCGGAPSNSTTTIKSKTDINTSESTAIAAPTSNASLTLFNVGGGGTGNTPVQNPLIPAAPPSAFGMPSASVKRAAIRQCSTEVISDTAVVTSRFGLSLPFIGGGVDTANQSLESSASSEELDKTVVLMAKFIFKMWEKASEGDATAIAFLTCYNVLLTKPAQPQTAAKEPAQQPVKNPIPLGGGRNPAPSEPPKG